MRQKRTLPGSLEPDIRPLAMAGSIHFRAAPLRPGFMGLTPNGCGSRVIKRYV